MAEQSDLLGRDAANEADALGAGLGDVAEHKWAPLLAELFDAIESAYRRQGQGEDQAASLAAVAVAAVAFAVGGKVVYIPRGDRLKKALRDNEIHSRWQRGATPEQLAEHYQVSVIHAYRIIDQQRRLHLAKTQGRLFDTGDSQ